MTALILHKGGKIASRDEVAAVPVPRATSSWSPVPYRDLLEYTWAQAQALGLEIVDEQLALNEAGDHFFAVLKLATGDGGMELAIGLRSSYNKTLATATAAGASVMVCDNLCFSGSGMKVLRKQTTNVWRDFTAMVEASMPRALGHYRDQQRDAAVMRSIPCPKDRGFALLGVALGHDVLTRQQASTAFADWTTPRHDEFAERNLWSLYNCVTEGLKRGQPARIMDRHARAHAFFAAMRGTSL